VEVNNHNFYIKPTIRSENEPKFFIEESTEQKITMMELMVDHDGYWLYFSTGNGF
jgi:hypothetical protein